PFLAALFRTGADDGRTDLARPGWGVGGGRRRGYRAGLAAGPAIALDRARLAHSQPQRRAQPFLPGRDVGPRADPRARGRTRRPPRARKLISRMDARQLQLLARRRLGRSGAKPDRIRLRGVAALRSFVARGRVRRRVGGGLLGVESARARTGDRYAGAA